MINLEKIVYDLVKISKNKTNIDKLILETLEKINKPKDILDTYKKELFDILNKNSDYLNLPEGNEIDVQLCHFPNHKGYLSLWLSLSQDMRKEMKENIKITDDGKVEIVPMKKKFSFLDADHDGHKVFDGSHRDPGGEKGIDGIKYFSPKIIVKICDNQNKKYIIDFAEVELLIDCFPGENRRNKTKNFTKLFDLGKTGFRNKHSKGWNRVGDLSGLGYIKMSVRNENKKAFEVYGSDMSFLASVCRWEDHHCYPFLCYEDVE